MVSPWTNTENATTANTTVTIVSRSATPRQSGCCAKTGDALGSERGSLK